MKVNKRSIVFVLSAFALAFILRQYVLPKPIDLNVVENVTIAINKEQNQTIIKWNEVQNAEFYQVQISYADDEILTYDSETTTFVFNYTLPLNVAYFVQIRAGVHQNNKDVYGPYSESVSFAQEPTATITNIQYFIDGNSLVFQWEPLPEDYTYEVKVEIPELNFIRTAEISEPTISDFFPYKGYSFNVSVRSCKHVGNVTIYGVYSPAITITDIS